jgi:large subunit ribosomal protein L23Ae
LEQVLTLAYRPDGSKKAFARLTADVDALDIAATKLAIV